MLSQPHRKSQFHFTSNGLLIWGIVLLLSHPLGALAQSNTTALKQWLLDGLEQQQVKESSVFPAGSFPSWRRYALNGGVEKADVNPFFTGLIDFTLLNIHQYFNRDQQQQIDKIRKGCQQIYPKFANRRGRPTYNFWPTDTPRIFPNGGWLNWFNQQQALPDDADDTVIILMAQRANDSTAKKVHQLLRDFANGQHQTIKNTYKEFRDLPAYSTWFGKKMPVDFDVCVLANILYFVQQYRLPWNDADSASLYLIEQCIAGDRYLTSPAFVSPHYQRVPVILYHLSRLMQLQPLAVLEKHKDKLVKETIDRLSKTNDYLDAVLLHTALLHWNIPYENTRLVNFDQWSAQIREGPFSFFVANMSSMLPGSLKTSLDRAALGKFFYNCPGYHYALVLENIIWQEIRNKEYIDVRTH